MTSMCLMRMQGTVSSRPLSTTDRWVLLFCCQLGLLMRACSCRGRPRAVVPLLVPLPFDQMT